MPTSFATADLEAYLDEALPSEEMARIEKSARGDRALVEQLASIHARRASGVHSLGEIWRQHRLSCPTREELASFLLGALPKPLGDSIALHIDVVGCRYCQANMADLRSRQAEAKQTADARRQKFVESSAGYLRGEKRGER